MEIIEELEPTRRGLYGGIVGYLDFAGDADTAIAIRTALVRDGTAYVQAGGGIVADSDPAAEDTECLNKARAVLSAVATAETLAAAAGVRAGLTAGVKRLMVAALVAQLLAAAALWGAADSAPPAGADGAGTATGTALRAIALLAVAGVAGTVASGGLLRRVIGAAARAWPGVARRRDRRRRRAPRPRCSPRSAPCCCSPPGACSPSRGPLLPRMGARFDAAETAASESSGPPRTRTGGRGRNSTPERTRPPLTQGPSGDPGPTRHPADRRHVAAWLERRRRDDRQAGVRLREEVAGEGESHA